MPSGFYTDGVWVYSNAGFAPAGAAPGQEEYTEPPAVTDADVVALLSADSVEIDFGVYLLDANDNVTEDISDDVDGGEVQHQCYDTIHGTCRLSLVRELDWENTKVLPFMRAIGAGHEAYWALGVYLLATPEVDLGVTPVTYEATGYDKLSLLSRPIGDSYTVASGTAYITAVQDAITASGVAGTVAIDSSAITTVLASDRVWILDSNQTTFLRVCNDLLAEVNYVGLYMTQEGKFTSHPYTAPANRTPTWTFDLADATTNIVGEARRFTLDAYQRTNWRRFIKTGLTAAPVETSAGTSSDTQVTIDDSGPGTEYRKIYYLDVADGAALYAEALKIVNDETQRKQTVEITTGPLPVLWHWDVVDYIDTELGTGPAKFQVASWRMPLDGGNVSITMERVDG
jgi:hypothetical protein